MRTNGHTENILAKHDDGRYSQSVGNQIAQTDD